MENTHLNKMQCCQLRKLSSFNPQKLHFQLQAGRVFSSDILSRHCREEGVIHWLICSVMVEGKHSLEQRDSVVCFVISQLRRTRWPHNYDHTHTHYPDSRFRPRFRAGIEIETEIENRAMR